MSIAIFFTFESLCVVERTNVKLYVLLKCFASLLCSTQHMLFRSMKQTKFAELRFLKYFSPWICTVSNICRMLLYCCYVKLFFWAHAEQIFTGLAMSSASSSTVPRFLWASLRLMLRKINVLVEFFYFCNTSQEFVLLLVVKYLHFYLNIDFVYFCHPVSPSTSTHFGSFDTRQRLDLHSFTSLLTLNFSNKCFIFLQGKLMLTLSVVLLYLILPKSSLWFRISHPNRGKNPSNISCFVFTARWCDIATSAY